MHIPYCLYMEDVLHERVMTSCACYIKHDMFLFMDIKLHLIQNEMGQNNLRLWARIIKQHSIHKYKTPRNRV